MTPSPFIIQVGTEAAAPFGDKPVVVVGRSRDVDFPVYDPACSRRQFSVSREGLEFVLVPLSENNPTFCNGVRATGATPVREDTLIEAGASQFRLVGLPANQPPPPPPVAVQPRPADNFPVPRATVIGTAPLNGAVPDLPLVRLREDVIFGRDPAAATNPLSHPLVSRRHALLRRTPGGAVVKDLGSANGTYLNGKRLGVAVGMAVGDRLQIGPYGLVYTGDALAPASTVAFSPQAEANVRLSAHQLNVVVGGRRLLQDVSLAIRGGEFVAVLGPSGCGKSTLLKTLSGAYPPTDGRVIFDACDLYSAPAGATRRVAVVPQREVLPTVLTVVEALRFTAALRLPPDTSAEDLERTVTSALAVVGLADFRTARISTLSGGQVKRVGLANELLADPGLVLLDEVTSGLDEQADREMMGLFRQLANGGKSVLAVTHTLAHVMEYCHRVVVLTRGGHLAFVGRPEDAISYFQIDRLGDVYDRLGDKAPEAWAKAWDANPRAARPPAPPPVLAGATVQESADTLPAIQHQGPILAQRTARVFLADRVAVFVTLGQPLLIALLLTWVFGDIRKPADPAAAAASSRSVLFVLAVTAFWLGCNTAAKEIVREWALHRKERQSHLSPAAYLVAKWGVLATVTVLQVGILFGIVAEGCHLSGSTRSMAILLGLVGVAGVSAGLLASAVASTEAVAVALVPVLVIPQIVLTDVFRPLSGTSKTFADLLISSHRGFNGVLTALSPDLAAVAAPAGVTVGGSAVWLLVQAVVIGLAAWKILDLRGRPQGLTLSPALIRLTGTVS